MALPKVTINLLSGGLDRPLEGTDFISGQIFYSTAMPSGFNNSNRIKQVFSVSDAEALGIVNSHIGEVKAVGSITIVNTGATNDVMSIVVNTPIASITLGSYTQPSTDTTLPLVAAAVASAINTLSASTGFVATASTSTVSFSAPAGSGVSGNAYTYSNVFSGTLSASTAAFTGGVGSQIDIMHYHVAEYFRGQPQGDLTIGIYSATTDYSEVSTLQAFALGKLKQVGVYTQTTFANSIVQYLQTQAEACEANEYPLEIFLTANFAGVSDLTTLGDLHALDSQYVTVCFGQDGGATGRNLFLAQGKTIGCVGLFLGMNAFGLVSDSVASPLKFRLDSVEMETLAMGNGALLKNLSPGLISNIDSKGYVFGRYMASLPGSYFNLPFTCTLTTSTYNKVNINRTVHKAVRGIRTFLDPLLSSPVKINADGTLSEPTMKFFKNQAKVSLEAMLNAQEISDFRVTINPVQNVVATGAIVISVSVIPMATADFITVNLGLVASFTS